jgi:hypothetical protein
MDVGTRALLRHLLAALAYRTQKAVRGAPSSFGTFAAGHGVRTPVALVRHMTSVLAFARSHVTGSRDRLDPLRDLDAEVERFHAMVADLAAHLERGDAFPGITAEQLLQGPFSDALAHAGQLALLRRLAGSPVAPEDFSLADVSPGRLGPDQALPKRPDGVWPEAPPGWIPPADV